MIPPTGFGLSKKKRLPLLYVGTSSFYPHQYAKVLFSMLDWSVRKREDGSFLCKHAGEELLLPNQYLTMLVSEWRNVWEKYYLPPRGVGGMTVLDAGAGSGETVHFYLRHGAARVIAVEPNADALSFLKRNALQNRWNVEIIERPFSKNIVDEFDFDFMKVDVEGAETELLELEILPPCVVEVHNFSSPDLANSLIKKFGMRVLKVLQENFVLMLANY
jgi:predicted RNA methylase